MKSKMEKNILGDRVEVYCFDRHGGYGQPPFDSLNVSYGVEDRPDIVTLNREQVKKRAGLKALLSASQVHGCGLVSFDGRSKTDVEVEGRDGLLTSLRNCGLMIQQADCQAILLYDSVNHVAAAAHCGWRGSVDGIIGKTVAEMKVRYRSQPQDLAALISPSLGPCCAEFVNYHSELPESFYGYDVGNSHFDFWAISRHQLEEAGLSDEKIHCMGICTCCNPDYFSYRRSGKKNKSTTGRNCSVIVLR